MTYLFGIRNFASRLEMNSVERDVAYYQRRAEEEVERARCATDPKRVSLHWELAELLLQRVSDLQSGPVAVDDRQGDPDVA